MIHCAENRNILLTVSYDGTNFHGWQKQTKQGVETFRSVQGEIEKALHKIHKHHVELFGSGRTDSGVHAIGQAANFFTDIKNIPVNNFIPALNSSLPKDIRITDVIEVSNDFNARFSAKSRTYRYFINCKKYPPAHELTYSWNIRYQPDIKKLNRMANYLKGELDCTTFSAAGDMSKSKSRYLHKAVFFFENELLVFEIQANAFLWKMVRSITGTILDLEKKNASSNEFKKALDSRNRRMAGVTAPANGLFLWKIEF
ncbi:MAG: tRNA pseudouridine(38-40) synthase TruA [Treponema sp.]|nr:MAG: tRNA pseudouridine(38-40) synthase TruA [Treponema sp.]